MGLIKHDHLVLERKDGSFVAILFWESKTFTIEWTSCYMYGSFVIATNDESDGQTFCDLVQTWL